MLNIKTYILSLFPKIAIAKKSFFGAALGTMVEYYDYAVFTTFLPIIAPLFFPGNSTHQSLLKGYIIILISSLARPLGGMFFGYFGDVFGRRKALLGSMLGIALATLAIGLTPLTTHFGLAIVIILIAKTTQVFCFGGEYNGAGIYVVEHAKNNHEGLMSGLLSATTLLGSLLASFIGILLTLSFMPTWSWRIAFILGGLLGLFGIFYRKNLPESPHFQKAKVSEHTFFNIIRLYPRELLAGIFIGGFATVPFTTVLIFINPMLASFGVFTNHQLMLIQTLLSFVAIVSLSLFGFLADRFSIIKTIRLGCWSLLLLSYPLLLLIESHHVHLILLAEISFIIINEILLAPCNAYLKSLFPMQYRYRAISFSFCMGMSLLGGLTPILENILYQFSGQFSSIAIWLIFIGGGTLYSITLIKDKINHFAINKEKLARY